MSRKKTLFFKAKNKRLSNIVSIENITSAKKSVVKLLTMFKKAKTRSFKIKIKRSTVLAGNRAMASAKRKNLSYKEKTALKQIATIYNKAAKKMQLD